MRMSAHNVPVGVKAGPMEDLSQVVDKSRPEPVYRQIADWISYKITVGDWPVDLRLPSEPDLAKAMGVSRSSLRKAMALLTSQHLLLQIQGKGTFVRSGAIEGVMEPRLRPVTEIFDSGSIPYCTHILVQSLLVPSEKLRRLLTTEPEEQVLNVKWLVTLAETPFVVSDIYLTGPWLEQLEHAELTIQSLYHTLEQVSGTRIARSRDVFAAVAAPAWISDLLKVTRNAPALHIERRLYDELNRLVLFSENWTRSDRLSVTLESTRRPEDTV